MLQPLLSILEKGILVFVDNFLLVFEEFAEKEIMVFNLGPEINYTKHKHHEKVYNTSCHLYLVTSFLLKTWFYTNFRIR